MARRTSALTGIDVGHLAFESLLEKPLQDRYDGIWCCASLLHVERDALPSVVGALRDALKPGGVMYVSFKHGETD
jgi:2-polyprenyl-3-methyl-5-hydroxy-6-metoxy-1,4-benzoquinol methylase